MTSPTLAAMFRRTRGASGPRIAACLGLGARARGRGPRGPPAEPGASKAAPRSLSQPGACGSARCGGPGWDTPPPEARPMTGPLGARPETHGQWRCSAGPTPARARRIPGRPAVTAAAAAGARGPKLSPGPARRSHPGQHRSETQPWADGRRAWWRCENSPALVFWCRGRGEGWATCCLA